MYSKLPVATLQLNQVRESYVYQDNQVSTYINQYCMFICKRTYMFLSQLMTLLHFIFIFEVSTET